MATFLTEGTTFAIWDSLGFFFEQPKKGPCFVFQLMPKRNVNQWLKWGWKTVMMFALGIAANPIRFFLLHPNNKRLCEMQIMLPNEFKHEPYTIFLTQTGPGKGLPCWLSSDNAKCTWFVDCVTSMESCGLVTMAILIRHTKKQLLNFHFKRKDEDFR